MKKTTFPERRVRSIYLDTPTLSDYYDSISGISRRQKTRLRWYNNASDKLVLEKKEKRNHLSNKSTVGLENPCHTVPRLKSDLLALAEYNYPHLSKITADSYHPILEVSYLRNYFELRHGIRMTIDTDIRYRKLYPLVSERRVSSPVDYLVEFKYLPNNAASFSNLIPDLPFRLFRHSKYVIGIDTVGLN